VFLTLRVRGLQQRIRLIRPLAVLAAAPLIGCAADPPLPVAGLLWAIAGAGIGYHFATNIALTTLVAARHRGQALGIASIGLLTSQTTALLLAGALARTINPTHIIAAAGILGTLAALALTATTGHHLTATSA
jgi:hypothetical protein